MESSLKEVILFRGCAVEFFAVSLFYEIDFFQWRASLKLDKLISNSPLNLRKRFVFKSELLSFVQCIEKAILLKLIHERPSKRFVLLSGHFEPIRILHLILGQFAM